MGDAPPSTKRLGDVTAVSEMMAVSPKTVRRMADAGKIPGLARVGRLVRFDLQQVADWCAAGCPPVHRFRQKGGR